MTSTAVGLPDRYRPLDQVGPDEVTESGAISTWRAKDRVLNRDVAIRVHTPGGSAAHAWIARALTAGGLATPALAMVYDASEGTGGGDGPDGPDGPAGPAGPAGPGGPGGAAYVVNEWIDGETLAERVGAGPLPEREARTVLRRLAEGVAEAHRVGLAVGGLTPENVVLRPNGLVGLRGVPAATGTVAGDISSLGRLLEFALTGKTGQEPVVAAGRRSGMAPDLAALIRRARSTDPGQGLSSVAAMASLLAERPRTGPTRQVGAPRSDDDAGPRRRFRRDDAAARADAPAESRAAAEDAGRSVPADPAPTVAPTVSAVVEPPAPTVSVDPRSVPAPAGHDLIFTGNAAADGGYDRGGYDTYDDVYDEDDDFASAESESPSVRRRLVVIGLPLLALALVIGLAVWFGTNVLSVASSVDEQGGSTPPATPTTTTSAAPTSASGQGTAVPVTGAQVFDPYGDGESENARDVPKSYDGDPHTSWSTLEYKGSAHFGNLKPGVGIVYDLGGAHDVTGVTVVTDLPGATVEIRTATSPGKKLDDFAPAGTAALDATTKIGFDKPANGRYVLVWVTGLVPSPKGFSADIAEFSVQAAH